MSRAPDSQLRRVLAIHDQADTVLAFRKYREFFVDTVYVLRDRPDASHDGWPFLRCTCRPFAVHGQCEHVLVCRSLPIPGMRDSPTSSEQITPHARRGRRPGSYTAARGKAAAQRRATG